MLSSLTTHTICINNRDYTNYSPIEINPLKHKLFDTDIITLDNDVIVEIKSQIKNNILAGILFLDKTFGTTKNGKSLYKCIPYNYKLPVFLIPHLIKKIGFSKVLQKKYILFKYDNWEHKHPQGAIYSVIGDISDINNYFEYRLHCKNLYFSAFTKYKEKCDTNELFDIISKKYNLQHNNTLNQHNHIFTIDSSRNCEYYDDAISVGYLNNNINSIKIYIANVAIILDHYNLWNEIADKLVSNIYFPNNIKSMLPKYIKELCSLEQGNKRFVFVTEFVLNNTQTKIKKVNHSISLVNITANYTCNSTELMNCKEYCDLIELLIFENCDKDPANIVEKLMVLTNYRASKLLITSKQGIFRNSIGKYVLEPDAIEHRFFGNLKSYTHITSPLRRIVDIVNSIIIFSNDFCGNEIKLSAFAQEFANKMIEKCNIINLQQRIIYNLQNECNLLYKYNNDNTIINKLWDAKIISITNEFITIYILNMKLYFSVKNTTTTTTNISINSIIKVKLYYFCDEINFLQKIRVEICTE